MQAIPSVPKQLFFIPADSRAAVKWVSTWIDQTAGKLGKEDTC